MKDDGGRGGGQNTWTKNAIPGHRECHLEKISVFINDKPVDELSMICPGSVAKQRARRIVAKLREEIPRQQFEVVIKACLGHSKKAIVQALLKPMKKDFSGVLKGGKGQNICSIA
jgi:GTP-binding protein LepA